MTALMTPPTVPATATKWPLSRVLMLLLSGAFVGLMTDIRLEHVDVVRERSIAWTPIVFSGIMTVACFFSAIFWGQAARWIMACLFSAAIGVGTLGFYLHNYGNILTAPKAMLDAWIDPNLKHADGPPHTAPLSFAGLGGIGILLTLKRFS